MALLKVTAVDKIEIVGEFKHVQVRIATWVEEDGVMIGSKQYSRNVVSPEDDVTGQPTDVQELVAAVHKPNVKAAYRAHLAVQAAKESKVDVEPIV